MSVQIKSSRYEKRLRIGVRFDGTQFFLLDGSPLPKLVKDAVCDLVFRADVMQDPKDQARFAKDEVLPVLAPGSVLLIGVGPNMVGDPKAPGLICNPQDLGIQTEYWLVEARLNEPLSIRIRGDQKAMLEQCRCDIPALHQQATSVNHAFTLISEAYETKRLAHTGNVFERAYTRDGPERWLTLDELRIKTIAQSVQRKRATIKEERA